MIQQEKQIMCIPIAVATGGLVSGCFMGDENGAHARWALLAAMLPMYVMVVWNFRRSIPHRIQQLRGWLAQKRSARSY